MIFTGFQRSIRNGIRTIDNSRRKLKSFNIGLCNAKLDRTDENLYDDHVHKLCEKGNIFEALQVAERMQESGYSISTEILMTILQGCIKLKDLEVGREVSAFIKKCGLESNNFLGTHVIRMFGSCGSLVEAKDVFVKLPQQSEFSWAAIISAHVKLGEEREALFLYQQMKLSDFRADGHVYVAALEACSHISALEEGKLIHMHVVEDGFCSNVYVGNCLICMYCKCRSLEDGMAVFRSLSRRDTFSWGGLISGYAEQGPYIEALRLFGLMQEEAVCYDKVVLTAALNACANLKAFYQGSMVHSLLTDIDITPDAFTQSAVVSMYFNCGSMDQAREVFDKLNNPGFVTWNTIISAYAQHKQGRKSIQIFNRMKLECVHQDTVTYLGIIKAGCGSGDLGTAKIIHINIIESGHGTNMVLQNFLIEMYAKCGCLEGAYNVFDKMEKRSAVSWNTMIQAYAQFGYEQEALYCYQKMFQENTSPDNVTFISILKVCTSVCALDHGQLIYANMIESNIEVCNVIGNTLINMYAKCGALKDALFMFNSISQRDVVTWTAIMEGFLKHNEYGEVVKLFTAMQKQGIQPNNVTFVCILTACCRIGLLEQGWSHFKSMQEDFNIAPTVEHYVCMIELFASTGRFNEAHELLESMPSGSSALGSRSLLSRYQSTCNISTNRTEMTKHVADYFSKSDIKLLHSNFACKI